MGIFELMGEYQDALVEGTLITLRMAVLSYLLAFVVGNVVAGCRVSPVPVLQRFAMAYVSLFRNTPLIVLGILVWVGGGRAGWPFGRLTTAIVVLGLYTGAYVAESLRSGINAVPVGQAEAARAIGLGFSQVLGQIVLPQAIRTVVPPLGNLWIANLKNTSVFLVIGIDELTRVGRIVGSNIANYVNAFTVIALIYLALVYGSAQIIGWIERRVAIAR
ncbi:amino acid ABC transporter permease [Egicoccus halophilus]|uniref:Glutamate ABC transporter permease n=1 Tax=Egicoccus halophilus TaxID=1670830 RepID=A0A8J3EUG1_9ACTN|nr:amino acid ABC transporter permease [Egicoccus halophilus]GGI07636.1 glutamate ABC transporter permease [Egicoccus halophilus]